jgi:large subunit ribosomal protein L4
LPSHICQRARRYAEVRGGGRKPFKQKGTGNARAGSTRTPLKPGGGVIFGPKPKDWSIKMNKKERRLAMATALQSCAEDMIVVEDLSDKVTTPKVGLYKLSPVDLTHSLTAPGFNPYAYYDMK